MVSLKPCISSRDLHINYFCTKINFMKRILLFASAVAVMFSSCSKDTTEVASLDDVKGAITASYEAEEGTRTSLSGSEWYGKRQIIWSDGDALGVFGPDKVNHVQFGLVSGAGTTSGEFSGNTHYLKNDGALYAYYPYTRGTELAGTSVELEILANQTYLANELGTFDAAQAPAVAYIEKVADAKKITDLKLKGVASYLAIPVTGIGTLQSLSINIGNQPLAGSASVDVTAEKPAFTLAQGESDITLNCSGVVLNPFKAQWVMVVVPAGTDLNQEITITAKIGNENIVVERPAKNGEFKTVANTTYTLAYANPYEAETKPADMDTAELAWSFGLEGKYIISTAEEFLAYAYMVQKNQQASFDGTNWSDTNLDDFPYAPKAADYATLTARGVNITDKAWICAEGNFLDFSDFTKTYAKEQYDALAALKGELDPSNPIDAEQLLMMNVWEWYYYNDGAINPLHYNAIIGSGYTTSGEAMLEGANGTTLYNLNVKGSGLTSGTELENIVLMGVDVTNHQANAALLANDSNDAVLKKVVVSTGNTVTVTGNYNKIASGLFTIYHNSSNVDVQMDYAVEVKAEAANDRVASLYGTYDISAGDNTKPVIDLSEYPIVVTAEKPAIGAISGINSIVTFTNATEVDDAYAGVIDNALNEKSVFVNGVGYWTGVNLADDGVAPYTAEELAYSLVELGSSGRNITLTNDLNMQKKLISLKWNSPTLSSTIDGAGHTISNVVAQNTEKGASFDSWSAATLFGHIANVSNLTVDGLKMTAVSGANTLAGLAGAGTAKDVTVKNVELVATALVTAYRKSIGAVFAEADANSIDNVTVVGAKVDAGELNLDVAYGILAGKLTISPNSAVTLKQFAINKAKYSMAGIKNGKQSFTSVADYNAAKMYANANVPFGTIYVDNASVAANGNITAKLYSNFTNAQSTGTLAIGVVFADALTLSVTKVSNAGDQASLDSYKYVFISDAKINGKTTFGFNE